MPHSTAQDVQLVDPFPDRTIRTRGYQQEMLEESLQRNVIIAMGTGSGKTHIAVLRMKIEVDREPKKVCWFLAPTVALCQQQKNVITQALPIPVAIISGANEPEHWVNPNLWKSVLSTHRIVVSTPQVLLDALRHSYVQMGRDLSLIVFDEAHHAGKDHPYNRIMAEFYFNCPARNPELSNAFLAAPQNVRPVILGLTASPIYGGNVIKSFEMIEHNLDSKIRAPLREQEELNRHVHKPVFKHLLYDSDPAPFSTNLAAFNDVLSSLDIEADPYIKRLRLNLAKLQRGSDRWRQADQKLSQTIRNKDTYTQRALRDVSSSATALCSDIGPWAADWLVYNTVEQGKQTLNQNKYDAVVSDLPNQEKAYLLDLLSGVRLTEPSYHPADITDDTSDKVHVLVQAILKEKKETEANNQTWNALVFVQRREAVLALAQVLSNHPETKDILQVGCLVGTTDTAYRTAALDLTKPLVKTQSSTLNNFKTGEKNLIISTAVAEEGIDIQACGSVIRWDPAANVASFLQSRGRARRQKSTFTLLIERGEQQNTLKDWERMEQEMVAQYSDPDRLLKPVLEDEECVIEERELVFKVESTGALLTLHSAVPHLNQFCALIPHTNYSDHRPIYELDPPDLPEGWHSSQNRTPSALYNGPWAAKVTLPRALPPDLRYFETESVYQSKVSAVRHAAFKAYKALYEQGLLNDNLLPLTSVIEPKLEEEVRELLKEVEKRQGTAKVSVQMNPWLGTTDAWYASELCISGTPPLFLFTRSKPTALFGQHSPILHRPEGRHSVTWQPLATQAGVDPETIAQAREYTRRLFWTMSGSRMVWDDLDFSYLFLPMNSEDAVWDARRSWHAQKINASPFLADALSFVRQFSHADDLAIVRNGPQFSKLFRFIRWRTEPLTKEEEDEVRTIYYSRFPSVEITYPMLVAYPLPPRTNFLVPLPDTAKPFNVPKSVNLLAPLSHIVLCSDVEAQYALLLPSVLRALAISLTIQSMRATMLAGTDLANIPLNLLTAALCAPVAQEQSNYERMETLGDTVLKFMVSLQLLGEYPHWHEGYLTKKMGHSVSNVKLAKANIEHGMYQWIVRDHMLGKKWKPSYFTPTLAESEVELEVDELVKKSRKKGQDLSTKVLADVVEALIGAAYLHGGFDLAVKCGQFFDLGVKWQPLPSRVESMLSRVETHSELPSELDCAERMLGYTFRRKLLLVEALTHCSYQQDLRTVSYERLEFCGDAVLDMIVTEYLYRSDKEYPPGKIFHRKSAIVNAHMLASIPKPDKDTPLRARTMNIEHVQRTVYLYQCMMHSNLHIYSEQVATAARVDARREEIENALESGDAFPWVPLFLLQAPKFLSDMMESLIGAVFLDAEGDLDVVRGVLRRLGLLPVLERMVAEDVDVLHPVSRLHLWASKQHVKVGYEYVQENGKISCTVSIDGEMKEETRTEDKYSGRLSKLEVRLQAADKANNACKSWTFESEDSKKRKRTFSDSGSPRKETQETAMVA
ncbi:hypothetical protein C8F01DRAFT_1119904 [Mycena amicta]|nr:hypothetical protein C8F01DRAFT_1119904 [Mycena amicta]